MDEFDKFQVELEKMIRSGFVEAKADYEKWINEGAKEAVRMAKEKSNGDECFAKSSIAAASIGVKLDGLNASRYAFLLFEVVESRNRDSFSE